MFFSDYFYGWGYVGFSYSMYSATFDIWWKYCIYFVWSEILFVSKDPTFDETVYECFNDLLDGLEPGRSIPIFLLVSDPSNPDYDGDSAIKLIMTMIYIFIGFIVSYGLFNNIIITSAFMIPFFITTSAFNDIKK